MKKVYYAHAMNIYGTKQEDRDLAEIRKLFPDHEIYNPSEDIFADDGYKKDGMEYFLNIIDSCSVLIFRSFIDSKIPAGVYKEIDRARSISIPVVELPSYYNRTVSVDDTRCYLKEIGYR